MDHKSGPAHVRPAGQHPRGDRQIGSLAWARRHRICCRSLRSSAASSMPTCSPRSPTSMMAPWATCATRRSSPRCSPRVTWRGATRSGTRSSSTRSTTASRPVGEGEPTGRSQQRSRSSVATIPASGSGSSPTTGLTPPRAPDVGKAISYAQLAGDRALAQLAPDEALRWYRDALDLLDRSGGDDSVRRAALLLGFGDAQTQLGDPAHRETLLAAGRLADEIGAIDILVHAALAQQPRVEQHCGRCRPRPRRDAQTCAHTAGRHGPP